MVVVRAVMAESALENAAATIPMVKGTIIQWPKVPELTNQGNNWSLTVGGVSCCCAQRV